MIEDRFAHRSERQNRRRAGSQARASAGFRLLACARGRRTFHRLARPLGMMAAAQPFLSGAISKTINMPEESTVEDIDGCLHRILEAGTESRSHLSRQFQALAAAFRCRPEERRKEDPTPAAERLRQRWPPCSRNCLAALSAAKMPDERASITHKFSHRRPRRLHHRRHV